MVEAKIASKKKVEWEEMKFSEAMTKAKTSLDTLEELIFWLEIIETAKRKFEAKALTQNNEVAIKLSKKGKPRIKAK